MGKQVTIANRLKACFGRPSAPAAIPEPHGPVSFAAGFAEGPPPPYNAWATKLRSLSDRLRGLSSATEGEFLSIGGNLRDTHARAGKISDVSSFVAASMSGEEINAAIDGLRGMVDRMNGFLSRAEEETARDEKSLRRILQTLGELRGPLKEFKKVVKFLRNLGIATKIESARMGENSGGFGVVAENVEKMSVLFATKSTDIAKRGAELDSVIVQTLSRVIEHQHGLRERARSILGEAGANLSALIETHGGCAATARVIMDSSSDVSRNVGEVVASMQFHDITRQQIEHVIQAVDDLAGKLEGMEAGPETAGLAGDVCRLQAAHLVNSRATMVKAADTVVANLRGISENSSGIARQTKQMSGGPAGHTGQNVLSGVEQGLSSVGSSLLEIAAAVREFSDVIRSIAHTVEEMSNFMNDIKEIGEEIELVALNAEIKAAHTGSKGAALGVLAESIQHLSVDSRSYRAAVSETLDDIRSAAAEMNESSGTVGDDSSRDSEVEEMQAGLAGLLESLSRVNGSIVAPLSQLDEGARALSESIDLIIRGMSAHDLVSEVVDGVVAGLGEIEAECRRIDPSWETSRKTADLRNLADRYTMHEERDIHLAVMGGGEMSPALAAAPAGASGSDFGDNVELF
ncbi:MAG: methyl-accepting chemotaxis sensory transducer [Deltaproteobacteria bacterium]|nr:methyl-accepting chemotaxis sensory transducer [Deltaproteobacteria bacterium]